jgi:hypothetical protein
VIGLPDYAVTPTDTRKPVHPVEGGADGERRVRALNLAQEIADATVRSDIESFAKTERIHSQYAAAFLAYSLTEPVEICTDGTGPMVTEEDSVEWLRIVQRAATYITQRGNVFPWRLVGVPGRPGWVQFVDKEGRPAAPEVRR